MTEKNQNDNECATIYAKIADIDYQAGRMNEGDASLAKAMQLDPANTNFPIQKGDMYVKQGKWMKHSKIKIKLWPAAGQILTCM